MGSDSRGASGPRRPARARAILAAALAAAGLVHACASGLPPDPFADTRLPTQAYDCEGSDVVVHFGEDEDLTLVLAGGSSRLVRVPADSGVKYSDGSVTFWVRSENDALFERVGRDVRVCALDRPRSFWADARIRGVHFRAIGNEPGWILEIDADRILVVTDYGRERAVFPRSSPEVDVDARRTVYRSESESRVLSIVVDGRVCRDTMSGETFDDSVMLTLDGRIYRGCGRSLRR